MRRLSGEPIIKNLGKTNPCTDYSDKVEVAVLHAHY